VARWQTLLKSLPNQKEILGNDEFNFPRQKESFSIQTNKVEGKWLAEILQNISVSVKSIRYKKLRLILRNNRF
jgi:hypothetical protein